MADIDKRAQWPGWETVRLIGRGSFGAVYEIERDLIDQREKAALKMISIPQNDSDIDEMYGDGYDDESITSTFQSHLKNIISEYTLMRKMNGSANVVNCDDVRYVQHDDGLGWDIFIKMELLTPLTKALPESIPEETVLAVAKDLCRALVLCKKYDIVHRDIKPQNIFVSPNGDYKLGDFGIAKTVEKTSGGTKIGTYKYMAPEVYNNQPYGAAADIYSLGLVLYWMLNERRMPFLPLPPQKLMAGMEENARLRRLSGEALPEPAHGSEKLKQIVLKACAYNPKDRYGSAAEMLADLEGIGKTSAQEISLTEPVAGEDDDKTIDMAFSEDKFEDQEEQTRGLWQTPVKDQESEKEQEPEKEKEAEDDKTEGVWIAPEAEKEKQAAERKVKLNKKAKIGILAACAVLIVAVAAFFALRAATVKELYDINGVLGAVQYFSLSGKLKKMVNYNADGEKTGWSEVAYDESGVLSNEYVYNSDGTLSHWVEYAFSENEKRIKVTEFNPDGSIDKVQEGTYTGNIKKADIWVKYYKITFYSAEGESYENEYDSDGNRIKLTQYKSDGIILCSYEYDSSGNYLKETWYNADGSIKYWIDYEYDSNGVLVNETKHQSG